MRWLRSQTGTGGRETTVGLGEGNVRPVPCHSRPPSKAVRFYGSSRKRGSTWSVPEIEPRFGDVDALTFSVELDDGYDE